MCRLLANAGSHCLGRSTMSDASPNFGLFSILRISSEFAGGYVMPPIAGSKEKKMSDSEKTLTAGYIVDNYPDCPQRQMALRLFRNGRIEQAEAWLDALDELIENGRSEFMREQGQRSA